MSATSVLLVMTRVVATQCGSEVLLHALHFFPLQTIESRYHTLSTQCPWGRWVAVVASVL